MGNFKFKTSTPKEVRKTLSTLVNLVANDEIDQKKANSIVYITNAILQSIRIDEQEKQIQELKQIVEEIKANE
jgi:alpha-N-acetylglucosamine transferase